MNEPDFNEAIAKGLKAAADRRDERLAILLCDEFREEIRDLERRKLPAIKNWRICQAAGLTAHQLEFADIAAAHATSGRGMSAVLRERCAEITQLMWEKIREEYGRVAYHQILGRLH